MRAARDLPLEENVADAAAARTMFEAVDACPKPVIARVNGHAMGGGAGLVACARRRDRRRGRQVRIHRDAAGHHPGADLAVRAARRSALATPARCSRPAGPSMPPRRTGSAWCTGWSAEGELDAAVAEAAADLLAAGPVAVAESQAAGARCHRVARAGRPAAERIAARCGSAPEGQEGLTAFLEKRKPAMGRTLRRVLIANRGEIAVRVVARLPRAGHRGGRRLHRRTSEDAAARRAGRRRRRRSPATWTGDAIVAAARMAGADAVHPGYGFLAERAGFAEAVLRGRAWCWIGPPPEAMRLLGDKVEARRLAEAAGVPVVPGYAGVDWTTTRCSPRPRRLGAPLLVKAAAGGGGRGMRGVDDLADLPEALAAARREAAAAFGDDRVFLERRLDGARHVEVQLLGRRARARACTWASATARCSAGTRRSSRSRRHRPSIAELRAAWARPRWPLAAAAGYVGAGTVEFLLAADGGWCFLELNARLQVEHPVTEAVTRHRPGARPARDRGRGAARARAGRRRLSRARHRGAAVRRGSRRRIPARDRSAATLLELPRWPGVSGRHRAPRGRPGRRCATTRCWPRSIAHAEDRDACVERLAAALAETRDPRRHHQPRLPALGARHSPASAPARRPPGSSTPSGAPELVPPLPEGACARAGGGRRLERVRRSHRRTRR